MLKNVVCDITYFAKFISYSHRCSMYQSYQPKIMLQYANFYISGKGSHLRQTAEYKLVKDLFRHYDTSVRPRYDSSDNVEVTIRFSLQQIYDLVSII